MWNLPFTFVSSSRHLPTAGAARGAARQAGGRHREVHRGRAGGGGEAGAAGAPGQQGVARGARHQLQDLPRKQTLVQREGSATLDIVKYYYYLWKMLHNTTLIYQQEIKKIFKGSGGRIIYFKIITFFFFVNYCKVLHFACFARRSQARLVNMSYLGSEW